MKIDNNGPNPLTDAADALKPATPNPHGADKARAAQVGPDAVALSPGARLLQAAFTEAAEPLAVRQDVVERMRTLLADGQVGQDTGALADSIIDDWLNERS
jgi:flagellar biosynthesis anti-sigma factor FlgM